MASGETVDVVLATYNGERFLDEQLESILGQVGVDLRVLIRDDGSSDGTVRLLEEWRSRDSRIILLDGAPPKLGATQNFAELLRASESSWVFLADQDDIWRPDKVRQMLRAVEESKMRGNRPLLVFSDFRVIDADGQIVQSVGLVSGHVQSLRGEFHLASLLSFDYIWGCTSAVSRELLNVALPIPADAVNHDYWLALMAASMDGIVYSPLPLVDYRKHDTNVTGGIDGRSFRLRLTRHLTVAGVRRSVTALARHDEQLWSLRARLVQRQAGAEAARDSLDLYLRGTRSGPIRRLCISRRIGARMSGRPQQLGRAWVVLCSALFRGRIDRMRDGH